MPRSRKSHEDIPTDESLELNDEMDEIDEHDPKRTQRLNALKKAQESRMAKAELRRKEKAIADFESAQRKDEISKKFDELQERLGTKSSETIHKALVDSNNVSSKAESVSKAKNKSKNIKPKTKQIVEKEESSSTESSEDEPPVVIKKRKSRKRREPRVVYELDSSSSDDERVQNVRRKAAMYYKTMFG